MKTKPALNLHRSLDTVLARVGAPEAPGHAGDEQIDELLVLTTASEVRKLQLEMQTLKGQMAAMRQQIRDLSYMAS